jgi:methylthioribose-1-phosphate isomerase
LDAERRHRDSDRARSAEEVLVMTGRTADGQVVPVEIAAAGSPARNDAFDVTPAR